MKNAKNKILFLAASTNDEERILADQKVRKIDGRLIAGSNRDKFELKDNLYLLIEDLQETLLRHRPSIVHFSAQGTKDGALVLLHGAGRPHIVPGDALVELLRILKDDIRVIFLDGCYTEALARKLKGSFDYVVSMDGAIDGDSSVIFSTHFYQGLSFGRDVDTAFYLGRNQLQNEGKPDYMKPVLHEKKAGGVAQPVQNTSGRFLKKSKKITSAGSV